MVAHSALQCSSIGTEGFAKYSIIRRMSIERGSAIANRNQQLLYSEGMSSITFSSMEVPGEILSKVLRVELHAT